MEIIFSVFIICILFKILFFILLPKPSYHKFFLKRMKQCLLYGDLSESVLSDLTDLRKCVEKNIDIEEVKDGETPLLLAIRYGFLCDRLRLGQIAADYLLSKGADPNHCVNATSPLLLASSPRTIRGTLYLLSRGKFPPWGPESSYYFVSKELIENLVNRGAEVNWQNIGGQTALHMAAAEGNLIAIETLLNLGADPKLKNNDGETALDLLNKIQNDPQICAQNNYEFSIVKIIPQLEDEPIYKLLKKETIDSNNSSAIKEYNEKETKSFFQKGVFMVKDLNGNPITGVVKAYYEDGSLKAEENYKNGRPNGLFRSYYKNGYLETESMYKEGKQESVKAYQPTGVLIEEAIFLDDAQKRNRKRYNNNGKLVSEDNFSGELGLRDGVEKFYYPNGNIQSEVHYKNGKQEGIAKTYYENGNIAFEENYHDGKLEGDGKSYYQNGLIEMELTFKHGVPVLGYLYDSNGIKRKMSKTELHKIMR